MTQQTATALDQQFKGCTKREDFHIPLRKGREVLYFTGNSLGLQAKGFDQVFDRESKRWKDLAVEGHFTGDTQWLSYHRHFQKGLAKLVGAKETEVVAMNSLTVNLHLMLQSFGEKPGKTKIILEQDIFPSDLFAVESFLRSKGRNPEEEICWWVPTEQGSYDINDLRELLHQHPDVALILLGGVNYLTGQVFDLQDIVGLAKQHDAYCGLDLAHAIGNIPLSLHEWKVDFAIWCSYKYLNGGPGAVGGAFVHQDHFSKDHDRLEGWWGVQEKARFEMKKTFEPAEGVDAWQLSNAAIFNMLGLEASLTLFDSVPHSTYFDKVKAMHQFLRKALQELDYIEVITPNTNQLGCQLSILYHGNQDITKKLQDENVVFDLRNHKGRKLIRVAPVPLYNTFKEIEEFSSCFKNLRP